MNPILQSLCRNSFFNSIGSAAASTASGKINVLWLSIQTLFTPSHPPLIAMGLIKYLVIITDPSTQHVGISRNGSYKFTMRYNLCEGLKDGDWKSMTPQEKNALMNYFKFAEPCEGLKSKLAHEARKVAKKIAKKMDYIKASQVSVKLDQNLVNSMDIDSDSTIRMPYDEAFNLIGWNSPEKKQQASGAVAHEIGHGIKEHSQKIRIYNILNDPDNDQWKEYRKILEKEQEKEADFLTLKVPYYARGLRDYFKADIENCINSNKIANCIYLFQDSDTHPSHLTRMYYLSKALCEQHPELNQDICEYTPLTP